MANDDSNQPKGFAGLDELVSKVDIPSLVSEPVPVPPRSAPPVSNVTPSSSRSSDSTQTYQESPRPALTGEKPSSAFAKWAVLGFIAIVVILAFSVNDNKSPQQSQYSSPSNTVPPAVTYTPQPASPPQESRSVTDIKLMEESLAPVGKGLTLNTPQIRYCAAEKIRIEAVEVFGRNDIDRYNAKIDNYNSRCASFRYRRGSLESINSELEARRDLLKEQARLEWFSGAREPTSSNTAAKSQALQPPPSTAPIAPIAPPVQQGSTKSSQGIPANAQLDFLGTGWECNRGFRRAGQECLRIDLPANSTIDYLGHDWECNRGFRRSGQECLRIDMPANSTIDYLGHDFECNRGFRQVGKECQALRVPPNAIVDYLGHDWECVGGYRRVGQECLRQ